MVELRKRPPPKELVDEAPAAKRSTSKARTAAKDKVSNGAAPKAVGAGTGKGKAAVNTSNNKKKTTATATAAPATEEVKDSREVDAEGKTKAKEINSSSSSAAAATDKETTETPLSTTSTNKILSLKTSPSLLTLPVTTHTSASSPDKTTLQSLLGQHQNIIIFTYPRASTPGCTTQACLFRDNFTSLQSRGYTVYGLSTDSAKANTTFATKQNLGYELICDPEGAIVKALGMGKAGGGSKSATRGVVILSLQKGADNNDDDDDQVIVKGWMQGGPQKTLDAVLEWIK